MNPSPQKREKVMRNLRTVKLLALAALLCAGGVPAEPATAAERAPKIKYQATTVTDGGSVRGSVTWSGPPPDIAPFPINKNPEFCDLDQTGQRKSQRLIVGKNAGVKNAVVYLDGISKGKPLAKEGPFTLNQKGCAYDPHILVVPRRAKVSLESSDDILHNMHMFGAATYNLPFPDQTSIAKAMRKKGVVRVQCDAGHGWMSAFVHVVEHPYYAITDENGAFAFTDVPPGNYQLKLWHEHWTVVDTTEKDGVVSSYTFADPIELTREVEVTSGADSTVDFEMKTDP